MMTKEEIYEFLKADGAKLSRAVQFISRETLEKMYEERFGCPVPDAAPPMPPQSDQSSGDAPEEAPDSDLLHDGDDIPQPPPTSAAPEIHLLRFADSGWCEVLGGSYTRGLYRPASVAEFLALKPYAAEVL